MFRYSLIILNILWFLELCWSILTDASSIKLLMSHWKDRVLLLSLYGPEWPTQFEKQHLQHPQFFITSNLVNFTETPPEVQEILRFPVDTLASGRSYECGSTWAVQGINGPCAPCRTTTMRMRRGLESWRIYTLDLCIFMVGFNFKTRTQRYFFHIPYSRIQ